MYDPPINNWESTDWTHEAYVFLNGVRRNLACSALKTAGREIDFLAELASSAETKQQRRRIFRRIDTVLASTSYFRGATRRYLNDEFARAALERSVRELQELFRLTQVMNDLNDSIPRPR